MRRLLVFVTCAFSALFGLGIGAQAAYSQTGTSDPVTSYTKTADVRLTMRDGVSIDTDEYVPTKGCPCPVILVQTPYRKSGSSVGMFNPYFPSHGYAEIVVDVRGTGSSEGYWTSFGPPEQEDGIELVNWAVHRGFSNGSVGLAGVSYAAINQFLTVENLSRPVSQAFDPSLTAAQAAKLEAERLALQGAVKAIFPIVPMSDPYRDVVFAGGNTDTGFIPLWLGLVNGLNAIPADDTAKNPAIALNAESEHLVDVGTFGAQAVGMATLGTYEHPAQQVVPTNFPDQAFDGPYYRTVAPISHIEDVSVPTFIVGGEYDIFQRGEPLLYRGLNLPTSKKKLLYGPWYHGSPTAHLSSDDGSTVVKDQQGNVVPSTNNLSLAWFDHWIKGANNGVDTFPTVETWQIGRGAWSADSTFPARGTEYVPWYLNGTASGSGAQALLDGGLGSSPATAGSAQLPWQPLTGACSRSTTQWTAGLAAVSNCDNDNSSAEQSGLSFTSQPFAKDYTVSGPIMADLWISSNRPDTTLIATITDVSPDGKTSDRVTAGSMVASLRQVTPTPCGAKVQDCSVYQDDVRVVPWHPYTYASHQPLAAGTPTEVQVEVFPTSLVLQPGHRLRLSITTGDFPHQGPNASILADSAGGVTTVYFGGNTPSRVYIGNVSLEEREVAGSQSRQPAVATAASASQNAGTATTVTAVRQAVTVPAHPASSTRLIGPAVAAGIAGLLGLVLVLGVAHLKRRAA